MMLTKEIHQRQNGKWCIVDPNVRINLDGFGLIPAWKGNYDTPGEAAAVIRAEAAEAEVARLRDELEYTQQSALSTQREWNKSHSEVERLRAALYTIAHNLDVTPGQPPTLEDAQAIAEDALAR